MYIVFLGKRRCEKEGLSDVPGEKWNGIKVPAETSETFDGEYCAEVNDSCDLADIITNRRAILSLSCTGKYGYLTKHYSPSESLFKKKDVKSGETKTLLYQPSWIQNKWWHTYSKDFQADLVKRVFYSMTLRQMHREEIW